MESHPTRHIRIGIIGSGIAGSSAAYFVRQDFGQSAEIVVFEKAPHIGGRIQEMEIAGEQVELGASIFLPINRYLVSFVTLLGLHPRQIDKTTTFGIWNGTSFDLKSPRSSILARVRMVLRYGLAPLHLQRLVKDSLKLWLTIYERQDQGWGFETPEELLKAMDLYPLTQQSSYDFFCTNGISERFLLEFINGGSRNHYGQDASINAMVNLASLAATVMTGGSLLSVHEGNNQLCQGLLRISEAVVRTDCRVRQVASLPPTNGTSSCYTLVADRDEAEHFDVVIVAMPLEEAEVVFQNIALPETAQITRAYQVTHVTLISGCLNPTYFGAKTLEDVPSFILTREDPAIPFSSINVVGQEARSGRKIYKLFSREQTSEDLLSALFIERDQTERRFWHAYPVLKPMSTWPPFQLSSGLYYVNAMESAISAMETEVIASRNVVNLLKSRKENE